MKNSKKIAFFKIGSFSHTNESIYNVLQNKFPDWEIEVIDIGEKGILNIKTVQNFYYAWSEYGFSIFKSKQHLVKSLVSNTYIFNLVKQKIAQKYADNDFVFTFQTQSLYDMSINGVPNFMYTDHTVLVNETYPSFESHLLYSENYLKCEKTIYENASMNFTMSNHVTNSIIDDYGIDKDKVACAYAGPNTIIKDVDQISDERFESKNILFVGINWERKGGPTLLKAFKKVLQVHPDAKLTIVGCTPDIDIENCIVVGKVPVTDVDKYYREASIFCLPTTLEPFGMVFVEAMTYKLPIVSTKLGALPDFVTEGMNGFLSESGDSDKLANNLITLLDSPSECKKFGENSARIVKETYTWKHVGDKIHKSIMSIIEE